MSYSYCLIDMDSTNVVGAYTSELAALRAVVQTVDLYGRESSEAATLVLVRTDQPAGVGFISGGPDLVELALSRFAEPA